MKRDFRFHVLGLTHLPVSERFNSCAFSQKIHKLCEILISKGHTVFLYGCETSDAPCTEFVQTHTMEELREGFGDKDYQGKSELGYDHEGEGFRVDWSGPPRAITVIVRQRMIDEINKRKRPNDFLLLTMGSYHKPIQNEINLYLSCEPGIGYRGSFANFRAFESSYVQYFTYGSQHPYESINGNHYDRVIPNYFRPRDFPFNDKPENYFVYLGRIIWRKGLIIAFKVCRYLNARLIISGQGWNKYDPEQRILEDQDGHTYHLTPKMEFIGFADAETRKKLLSRAKAAFCPSIYLEPFCGVNVEAQMCGTPVLTTNFGAFVETVEHGKTGFRCDTLNDFVEAAQKVDQLNRYYIHQRAVSLYSCEAVAELFEKWWQDLYDVYESTISSKLGWNRIREIPVLTSGEGLDKIEHVIFINLAERKDRLQSIEENLKVIFGQDYDKKVQRFNAIVDQKNGHRGCAKSHTFVLEMARDNNWSNVMVVEDDANFLCSRFQLDTWLLEFFNRDLPWDVLLLGSMYSKIGERVSDHWNRVYKAQMATCYVVNSTYYDKLIECYRMSIENLLDNPTKENLDEWALDQAWNKFQGQDRWFGCYPVCVAQPDGFSDTSKKMYRRGQDILMEQFEQATKSFPWEEMTLNSAYEYARNICQIEGRDPRFVQIEETNLNKPVDILRIEGSSIQQLDFTRFRPIVIVINWNVLSDDERDTVLHLLQKNWYSYSFENELLIAIDYKIVWLYWENPPGKEKPAYLEICWESMKRNINSSRLLMLDEKTVNRFIPEGLNPEVWNFKFIAQRADYIRVRLIAQYGGIWLDADTIVLRDLKPIWDKLLNPHWNLIAWSEEQTDDQVSNGFFAARPKSPVLLDWLRENNKTLAVYQDDFENMPWPQLGGWNLTQVVINKYRKTCLTRMDKQIVLTKYLDVFKPIDSSFSQWEDSLLIPLFVKYWGEKLDDLSLESLPYTNHILAGWMRLSLGLEASNS